MGKSPLERNQARKGGEEQSGFLTQRGSEVRDLLGALWKLPTLACHIRKMTQHFEGKKTTSNPFSLLRYAGIKPNRLLVQYFIQHS